MFNIHRRSAARLAAAGLATGLLAAGALAGAGSRGSRRRAPRRRAVRPPPSSGLQDDLSDNATVTTTSGDSDQRSPRACSRCPSTAAAACRRTASTCTTPPSGTPSTRRRPGAGPRCAGQHKATRARSVDPAALLPAGQRPRRARRQGGGSGRLTEQDAAAGTQVAIWRYSDDADVDAVDPRAEKLADYLEQSAADIAEPAGLADARPARRLRPARRAARTGDRAHQRDSVTVTPPADAAAAGSRIVDKDGKPVTSAADGSQLYFDVPGDGAARRHGRADRPGLHHRAGRPGLRLRQPRARRRSWPAPASPRSPRRPPPTWAEKGAIPALSAEKNCAKGGVDITAANKGDEAFIFALMGTEHTSRPASPGRCTVPLQEDQAYDFTITGPQGGFEQTLHRRPGLQDRATAAAWPTQTRRPQTLAEPEPATSAAAPARPRRDRRSAAPPR